MKKKSYLASLSLWMLPEKIWMLVVTSGSCENLGNATDSSVLS